MKIAVYCGSAMGSSTSFTAGAAALGKAIAAAGHTLVYGGSNTGLMRVVADAALEQGGEVIGVQPNVPLILAQKHEGLTQYITTDTMAQRKQKMMDLSDAYVALPGGPGTLDEVSEILALARLGINTKPCVLFDIDGYYAPMKTMFSTMVDSGFARAEDFRSVLISDDLSAVMAHLQNG